MRLSDAAKNLNSGGGGGGVATFYPLLIRRGITNSADTAVGEILIIRAAAAVLRGEREEFDVITS